MRTAAFTWENVETLKTLKQAGKTYAYIAEHMGFPEDFLKKRAAESGLTGTKTAGWSQEAEATLRQLWNTGLSASLIGKRLGFSRSAVLGKVHRMGLSGRVTQTSRVYPAKSKMQRRSEAAKKGRRTRERFEAARADTVAEIILPSETAPPNATPLIDMRNDQCRWPYGDGPFVFCPEIREQGFQYCLGHQAKAINPLQPKARVKQ